MCSQRLQNGGHESPLALRLAPGDAPLNTFIYQCFEKRRAWYTNNKKTNIHSRSRNS